MFVPEPFEETRVEVLHELIRAHPFGVLVTLNEGNLEANHLPFELDSEPAPFGTLRGHVARANPVWHAHAGANETLAIFQGPQAYISPGWYETKKRTGEVVPTYNYAVVHAYGTLRAIEEREWLRGLVERLTRRHEAGKPAPWEVSDAPSGYIERMLGAIVGLELRITRLVGKWKVSQNRPAADRAGVVEGLRGTDDPQARAMAALVERRAPES